MHSVTINGGSFRNCNTGISIDSSVNLNISGLEISQCERGIHIRDNKNHQAVRGGLPDGHFRLSIMTLLVREYLKLKK